MRRKQNHNIDRLKAIRGLERKDHFASGKTLAAWRGRHTVTQNQKLKADRTACRKWRHED